MTTTYNEVFETFKDNITDPDLILLSDDLQNETLTAIMEKAISRCKRIISPIVDLDERSDNDTSFKNKLPSEVIDIISEWMIVFWLRPFVNNLENLRNSLSTKDFSVFSPANLLEKIGDRYDKSYRYARSLMNEYSYIIADMKNLKT